MNLFKFVEYKKKLRIKIQRKERLVFEKEIDNVRKMYDKIIAGKDILIFAQEEKFNKCVEEAQTALKRLAAEHSRKEIEIQAGADKRVEKIKLEADKYGKKELEEVEAINKQLVGQQQFLQNWFAKQMKNQNKVKKDVDSVVAIMSRYNETVKNAAQILLRLPTTVNEIENFIERIVESIETTGRLAMDFENQSQSKMEENLKLVNRDNRYER